MSPSPSIEPSSGAYSPVQFLFVYGTLRRAYMLLPHQLRRMRPPHILDTHGKWVGTGVLREHELWDLGSYPGLLKGKHGEVVLGDVYSVQTSAWEELDRYEGIAPEYERPQEYLREVVEIEMDAREGGERKVLKSWVYFYNWPLDKRTDTLIPDGDFVRYVAKKM